MIDFFSWAGMALIMVQTTLMTSISAKVRFAGFCLALFACFAWFGVGYLSINIPLMILNVYLFGISIRGMRTNYQEMTK